MRERQEIQTGSPADSDPPQDTTGATIPPASPSIDSVGQIKIGLTTSALMNLKEPRKAKSPSMRPKNSCARIPTNANEGKGLDMDEEIDLESRRRLPSTEVVWFEAELIKESRFSTTKKSWAKSSSRSMPGMVRGATRAEEPVHSKTATKHRA